MKALRIVGIAACVAGIAHTYLAKENIIRAAEARGHQAHIETQGVIGTEDAIPADKLKESDVVVIAADVKISGRDRFEGKRIIEIPTTVAVQNADRLIEKIEELMDQE